METLRAYIIYAEIICYFGMIWLMATMQKRGTLTGNYFALAQLIFVSLFVLTGSLLAPPTYCITLIWAAITIIIWLVGYPFARWLYRQIFPQR